MTTDVPESTSNWPVAVDIPLVSEAGTQAPLAIYPGITTLVGPNGSGKTRALRAIKSALQSHNRVPLNGKKLHFLAAGRSSPLETFRAAVNHPGSADSADTAVGHVSYRNQWWDFESVTGSLLVLDSRADLRLKIEARLQQLFDRSVELSWSQQGLVVRITPMSGGGTYQANYEASGILQLVALLAAIHNDEIGVLLIDEPEISLHPQHQAFVLEEMQSVAGEPSEQGRKLIIIATHSASLLAIRKANDLPALAFFNSVSQPPAQVPASADILKRAKLGALVARLSTTHRMAMFAERVLLVEGPSDEIIATQLARRLQLRLLARNAQILPITGKGEFTEATKLFRLMNKHVAVLADLDALADDNGLVCQFSDLPEAAAVADGLGRTNLADLDADLRSALAMFMSKHESDVDAAAALYADWSSSASGVEAKRRVTLARVLTDPTSFGLGPAADAESLRTRYKVLLDALAELGCFFLRRGAVENYYQTSERAGSKPELAALEAAEFDGRATEELERNYSDVVTALTRIAPNQRVDEDRLLRPKLGAALAAAFLGLNAASSDDQLNATARATIGSDADVFKLTNSSTDDLRIKVEIASPLFERETFPFDIGRSDNLNIVVPEKLPGIP